MTRAFCGALLVAICCSGCLGRPINASCTWPGEPAARLDLRSGSDRRHLNADARFAEELAIHYADVTRGRRSGHFTAIDDYHRARARCLAALSIEVAGRHGITAAEVAGAVGQRDVLLDTSVLLVFAVLYAFTANRFVRQLFVRFPPADDRWPALVGTAVAAIGVSAAAMIAGWIGSTIIETIQLGDLHMSYRAERMLWNRHWPALFLGSVILFSLIAIARWRRPSQD